MKPYFIIFLVLLAVPINAERIELAPFAGIRFGGSFQDANTGESIRVNSDVSYGANASFKLPIQFDWLEFHFSQQDSELQSSSLPNSIDVRINYYQGGILREFEVDKFRPFLVGYLGMTHLTFSGESSDQNVFSVGAGGGFKYFFTDWFGLRSDLRVYASITDGSTAVKCNGGCVVRFSGSAYYQGEIAQSVVIKF